jgi:hypothetical protein
VRREELTLSTIQGEPEPEQFLKESPYMSAGLTRTSGGIAVFNCADHLEKGPFAHPNLDANLPIAHRLAGFSACNATLARTIYTLLALFEKKV